MNKMKFLKSNIKFEPLSWNWYSWVHMISPLTACMNLHNRYFDILESFISSPELHIEASNDPNLIGGPFINLPTTYVNKVANLLNNTKNETQSLNQLYNSLQELNTLININQHGSSLEALYNKIPDNLKGLVELVYDENSNCSVRYIEQFFYSKFYNANSQSVLISEISNDVRSFVLSTPRFEEPNEVKINTPFNSTILDEIFKSRDVAINVEELMDNIALEDNQKLVFENFFQDYKASAKPEVDHDMVNIKYLGHACLLIQYQDKSILIDPLISYNYESDLDRFTYDDLPEQIDYVFITHAHQDHISLETLLQLRYKIKNIVVPKNNLGFLLDPSLKLILKNLGFMNVIEIAEMDSIDLGFGEITAIPFLGEHGDYNIQSKLAYVMYVKNKRFLFAVDSNNLAHNMYNNIKDIIGKIDVLYIGMECEGAPQSWLYGPLLFTPLNYEADKCRRLSGSNFKKAWAMVQTLEPSEVYIYAMGQEPWLSHIMGLGYSEDSTQILESNKLLQECLKYNITSERLFLKKEWNY